MSEKKAKYNIKAVCNILGIQPGTLRAWERRYNIVEPIRNDAGHRLYTDYHVAILRWLIEKLNKGFTIGQAVGLLEKGMFSEETLKTEVNENKVTALGSQLETALLNFNEIKANEVLNEAFSLFSVEVVMIHIISEVLKSVGDKWENGEITVAHEHYASQYLRTRIGVIFHHMTIDGILPKVVAVCAPNEKHELGLLIFTLVLRKKGYDVIYLGTGIPTTDVDTVLEQVKPKFLVLSCTLEENLADTLSLVNQLKNKYDDIKIGIGGKAVDDINDELKQEYSDHIIGNEKTDWEMWVK